MDEILNMGLFQILKMGLASILNMGLPKILNMGRLNSEHGIDMLKL